MHVLVMWNINLADGGPPILQNSDHVSLQPFVSSKENEENADTDNIVLYRRSYNASTKNWTRLAGDAVPKNATERTITLHQRYVSMWVLICYLSLVVVVLIFLVGFRGQNNAILGWKQSSSSMHNHTAVMLVAIYSAFGWTMSNGIVFNPTAVAVE
jgi:hypothetical protein